MGETAAIRDSVVLRPTRAMGRLRFRSFAPLSVHAHVVGLILVIIVPLLAFSAFLLLRSAAHEQAMTAATVRQRTREAAATIDRALGAQRTKLFILAGSRNLQMGDMAAFRMEAVEATRQDGLSIVLTDFTGQELINTRAREGAALPVSDDLEDIRRVAEAGLPNVSRLTRGALSGNLVASVNVPVLQDGSVAYVLSLNVLPLLPQILADLRLPDDWLVVIDDQDGRTIARTRAADRFVGQLGQPEALARLHAADEGWFQLTSREGVPVSNAFAHLPSAGWTVSIAIPDAVLFAPVRYSTLILVLTGAVALALALVLALAIGHRIAKAITGLVGYAEVVGRGDHISMPATGIRETDAVARSLHLASERIRQSVQERAMLLDRTVTTQEAERKRIARELHDSLGQYLTALGLGLAAIESVCSSHPEARQRLGELKTLAADIGRELNRIAWELRPMALDDLGLHRAITQYLEEWADRSRLLIDLEINLGDRRLPQSIETALFRVLQEALTNVVKHARASRVGVIVAAANDEVRLIVEDDGRGFDLDSAAGLGLHRLGLVGVRERLALVGGTLDLESTAQGGTTVYVRIPL